MEVASALAAKMSDAAAVGAAASSLLGVVDGTAGAKPKIAAERTGTLVAIAALAAAPAGSGTALAGEAQRIAERLCKCYGADSSEEVRHRRHMSRSMSRARYSPGHSKRP